jgi:tetratricopeptide (TPR) repeat protein
MMAAVKTHNTAARHDEFLSPTQNLAAGLAGAAVCASILLGRLMHWERAPFPYMWRDVAMVHVLAAVPLAGAIALFIRRRHSMAVCVGLGAFSAALSVSLIVSASSESATLGSSFAAIGLVLRAAPAFGLALSAALACAVLFHRAESQAKRLPAKQRTAACLLGIITLLLAPTFYVAARARDDTARLRELLEQSRLGEARELAGGLLALDPGAQLQGYPLHDVLPRIDQTARQLEARVAVPLVMNATHQERFDRARDLAILGHTDEAVAVLQSWPGATASADACSLRGTIYEMREEWKTARDWYAHALRAWEGSARLPEREVRLVQATKGIAFCERKLGRYREAETAYLQVLALSPTADTHFLLAQFYEDTQQTTNARTHAVQAMTLAPDRYQRQGQQLIDKLVTSHFGCWGL